MGGFVRLTLCSLAYAELYLALARLFATYEMELFGTDEKCMEWRDHGVIHTCGLLRVLAKLRGQRGV